MKRFVMQNEKEAVIVQGKDLRFLDSQARTPKSIKKLITFEHIDVNNQEKEFIFYEKEFVHYMKNADFILNKDDFHNVSDEEAYAQIVGVEEEINKIKMQMENDLKNKIDVTKKRHDLAELYHKELSILYFLDHEKSEKKTR